MKLTSFAYNTFSQYGEDGIIEKVFEIIGPRSKLCIEFGAWDGFHYSNTANLWTKGWTGILIEGDADKAIILKSNVAPYKCIPICRYVGSTKGQTLDDILLEYNIDETADLVSVDIDGDEYHVISTMERLRPRVIICEYNPTMPYWLDIYAPPGTHIGSSVSALVRILADKGYRIVAITEANCIFVLEEEYSKFKLYNTDIPTMANHDNLNCIITSYSGKYFVHGNFPFGLFAKYGDAIKTDKSTMTKILGSKLFIINLINVKSLVKAIAMSLRSKIAPTKSQS
jgi:hypothetical protein